MVFFVLSFFPRDIVDEILDSIQSVLKDFSHLLLYYRHTQPYLNPRNVNTVTVHV